jgi:hypothetical protein
MSNGSSIGGGILRQLLVAGGSALLSAGITAAYLLTIVVSKEFAARDEHRAASEALRTIGVLHVQAEGDARKLNELVGVAHANAKQFESLAHASHAEIARVLSRDDAFLAKVRADTSGAFVTAVPAQNLFEFARYETWPTRLAVKSTGRPMLVYLQTAQWRGQGVLEDCTPVQISLAAESQDGHDPSQRKTVEIYQKVIDYQEASAGGASLTWVGTLPPGLWQIHVTWIQGGSGDIPEGKKVRTLGEGRLIAVELPVNWH